jgi:TetR/AcrR family fatty acid metabolism transcriptional regulator
MPRATDIEERREQILRAAVTVFGKRGYTNATISDIANEAGVAHGTVYLYFHSKADIFKYLMTWFTDRLIADISGPAGGGDDGRLSSDLARMFRAALDACHRNPRMTAVCMREYIAAAPDAASSLRTLGQTLTQQLSARITRAIDDGEVRPMPAEFAADLISRLLGVAIERLLALEPNVDVDHLAREMVDFIMLGLASERSRNNLASSIVTPLKTDPPGTPGREGSPPRCGDREDER